MGGKSYEQLDEVKLLKQARGFDEGALTCIYQAHHDAIYRYIFRHLGDVQTTQDITADVFRRFLQALSNGAGPTRQLSAWLYRVAHNLIVDELRRRRHRDHESLDEALVDTLRDDDDSLEKLAGNAIAIERVRSALLELTEEQRQVLNLKFLEGLSNAEVAEIIGKKVGAVKALQHRGLEALRAQLTTQLEPVPVALSSKQVAVLSLRS